MGVNSGRLEQLFVVGAEKGRKSLREESGGASESGVPSDTEGEGVGESAVCTVNSDGDLRIVGLRFSRGHANAKAKHDTNVKTDQIPPTTPNNDTGVEGEAAMPAAPRKGVAVAAVPNVTLRAGNVYALTGPNGCGKSTLFEIISTLSCTSAAAELARSKAGTSSTGKGTGKGKCGGDCCNVDAYKTDEGKCAAKTGLAGSIFEGIG